MPFVHLSLIFLISIQAINGSEVVRKAQEQSNPYTTLGLEPAANFLAFEKLNLPWNKIIPPVGPQVLRVATYNIHSHVNIIGVDNTYSIKRDLMGFNPGVIIFQEVLVKTTNERAGFDKMLDDLKYDHRIMASLENSPVGNMIASRYPLKNIGQRDIGGAGIVLAAALMVNDKEIAIIGTQLEANDQRTGVSHENIRKSQAKKIMEFLKENIFGKYSNYVFGGDMNSLWHSPVIQTLVNYRKFKDVFNLAGVSYPTYTWWMGTTVDFLFFGPKRRNGPVSGAYIFHTDSSCHVPVLVDIEVEKMAKQSIRSVQNRIQPGQSNHSLDPHSQSTRKSARSTQPTQVSTNATLSSKPTKKQRENLQDLMNEFEIKEHGTFTVDSASQPNGQPTMLLNSTTAKQ